MAFILIAIALLLILLVTLVIVRKSEPSLPGPWGVPLLGYYPFMQEEPISVVQSLTKRYGRIFEVNLLGQRVIFLNDLQLAKEALIINSDLTSGRPKGFTLLKTPTLKASSILDGHIWSVQRKVNLKALSALGASERGMESYVKQEVEKLVKAIESTVDTPFDYLELVTHFCINTASLFLFSKRFELDDPDYIAIRDDARKLVSLVPGVDGFCFGPVFHWLCKLRGNQVEQMREISTKSVRIFARFVQDRLQCHTEGESSDVLDFYIQNHIQEKKSGVKQPAFDEDAMAQNIFDNLFGAAESVPQLLYYGLRLMTLYPEVQREVQKEIDEVIGDNRTVSWVDRSALHFTQAVLSEIQRVALQNPFLILHTTTGRVTLGGSYRIPPGCGLVVNNAKISRDEKYFKSPDNFDPGNFLDQSGQYVKNEAFIPFSIGPRQCSGLRFVQLQLLVGFVTLLQKFRWETCEDKEAESMEKLKETGFPRPTRQLFKVHLRTKD